MLCPTLRRCLCVCAALISLQSNASALVLDWDTISWADGSLSNSYDVDPVDPVSNVTVQVSSNNGAPIVPWSGGGNPMTPAVAGAFQGGLSSVENTLTIGIDLGNASQSITVTVFFAASEGATDVSFKLFDIDGGAPYQDHLTSIRALSIDGSTLIAPIITTSAGNTLLGSGLGQSVVGTALSTDIGANSGRGNVTINFGPDAIQYFTFTYGSTPGFSNPAYQHFGIHDITFTPVPEINPAVVSVLSCCLVGGLIFRHRTLARRKQKDR